MPFCLDMLRKLYRTVDSVQNLNAEGREVRAVVKQRAVVVVHYDPMEVSGFFLVGNS